MTNPNLDYWNDEQVTLYDRKQQLLTPRKEKMLKTVVRAIPFPKDNTFHVLDIGAGQGALSEKIIRYYPNAYVSLLDASPAMLAVAKTRLKTFDSRTSFIEASFNQRDWSQTVEKKIDVIVTSLALHYLETKQRLSFYKEASALLSPSGVFILADSFNAETKQQQKELEKEMLLFTQQQIRNIEGKEVSIQELEQQRNTETAKAGVNRVTLSQQQKLFGQAGFTKINIIWQHLILAIITVYKT